MFLQADPWSYASLPTGYGNLLVWNSVDRSNATHKLVIVRNVTLEFALFFLARSAWSTINFYWTHLIFVLILTFNQKPSFTWCSDLRVTANQIMFHTFREKSRGLHTRLATENLRRHFLAFFSKRRGRLYTTKAYNNKSKETKREVEMMLTYRLI